MFEMEEWAIRMVLFEDATERAISIYIYIYIYIYG